MKPVKQISVDSELGDCMRACLASILELPNGTHLPHIDSPSWPLDWDKFLSRFGLRLGSSFGAFWKEGYWIASVPSLNYKEGTHAVVMFGQKVAFDPSTKKRYRKGTHLLGTKLVVEGKWFEVSDFGKLHLLDEYRKSQTSEANTKEV